MLLELALLLVAVPLILIALGYLARSPFPLVAGGIAFIVIGVLIFASPVYTAQLNSTSETSHVWNCSNYTSTDCTGRPEEWSCNAYNQTQCRAITGCTWDDKQLYCSGTPELTCHELWDYGGVEKCLETRGCYVWNETNPHECDNYDTTYTYSEIELDENSNTIFGVLLVFVGLFCMVTGALSWKD